MRNSASVFLLVLGALAAPCFAQVKFVPTPGALAPATVGVAYAQTVSVTPVAGSINSVTYQITSGSLPDGLTLKTVTMAAAATGMMVADISGTPKTAGTFKFTITFVATDSNGTFSGSGPYSIVVNSAGPTATATLFPPIATGGVPTTFVITYSGCSLLSSAEAHQGTRTADATLPTTSSGMGAVPGQVFSEAGMAPIPINILDSTHGFVTTTLPTLQGTVGTFGFKILGTSCNGAFGSGLEVLAGAGLGSPKSYDRLAPELPFATDGLRGFVQKSLGRSVLDSYDSHVFLPRILGFQSSPRFAATHFVSDVKKLCRDGFGLFFSGLSRIQARPASWNQFAGIGKIGRSGVSSRLQGSKAVNINNGNLFVDAPGLSIGGGVSCLSFRLFYNSEEGNTGSAGIGWRSSYDSALIIRSANILVTKPNGEKSIFFFPSKPTTPLVLIPGSPGGRDVLQKNPDGTYTLKSGDVQSDFSTDGQFTAFGDANGHKQTLTYASGNLAMVADSFGRMLRFTYDSSNRIIGVSDSSGRDVKYAYDSLGRLISHTDAIGDVTQYTYNVNNQLIQITDSLGRAEVQFQYDARGRVVSRTDALSSVTTYAYNTPSRGTTTVTDGLGNATQFVYDSRGRLSSIMNALGGVRSVTYDVNNKIATSTDPLGHVWRFTYDANSNLTQATDPLGNSSKFTYDMEFNLVSATDALSHKTTFNYDSRNNLTRVQDAGGGVRTFSYNSFGQVASSQDPRNSVTDYEYDSAGNLIESKDPLGGVTQFTYDAAGRLTGVTDALKNHYAFAYDALDRLIKTNDPAGRITSAKYDANGNLVSETDARKIVTQFVYDALSRPASRIEAVGTSEQRTTNFAYDLNSNLTEVTDPDHNVTQYAYDGLNHMVSKTDPLGNMATAAYDANGNLIALTDGNGNTNRVAYDGLNRPTNVTPFTGNTISYTYDKAGNETSMTDGHGVSSYRHDPVNRLTSVHTPEGDVLTYTYGIDGRLISIALPDGTKQQYTYDLQDRVTAARDSAGKATLYTYDQAGQVLQETYPNGDSTKYSYDPIGRVASRTLSRGSMTLSSDKYQYDADNNRVKDTSAAGTTAYGYDHLNRLTSETAGNGQVTKYTYDANGNRTSVTRPSGVTKYTYDKANRMLTAGSIALSYDHNGNLADDGTHMFAYDAFDRLTSITGYNTSYAYDGGGRRIAQTTPAGTYRYVNNPLNGQVLLEDGPDGKFVNLYAGGRPISETSSSLQLYYHFDSIGNVVAVTDSTGKDVQNYIYDAFGIEISSDALGDKNKRRALRGYTDPITDFVYLGGSRYYNPAWGRTFSGTTVGGYPDSDVYQEDNPLR